MAPGWPRPFRSSCNMPQPTLFHSLHLIQVIKSKKSWKNKIIKKKILLIILSILFPSILDAFVFRRLDSEQNAPGNIGLVCFFSGIDCSRTSNYYISGIDRGANSKEQNDWDGRNKRELYIFTAQLLTYLFLVIYIYIYLPLHINLSHSLYTVFIIFFFLFFNCNSFLFTLLIIIVGPFSSTIFFFLIYFL